MEEPMKVQALMRFEQMTFETAVYKLFQYVMKPLESCMLYGLSITSAICILVM